MKHVKASSQAVEVDPSWKIGIVASNFYKEEMDTLTQHAVTALENAGIPTKNITVHHAAGSFEVPLIGAALAENKEVDALIGLGIIVEGETHHARLLADSTAAGILEVQVKYVIPFAFEILYVDTLQLAHDRLNKGEEAAMSVLDSLAKLRSIHA